MAKKIKGVKTQHTFQQHNIMKTSQVVPTKRMLRIWSKDELTKLYF